MEKMKKAIKVIFTLAFVVLSIFAIRKLIINIYSESFLFVVLAFGSFVMHLFAWIAPKNFFDLCWKLIDHTTDNFDYDTGYSKVGNVDIAYVISSVGLLGISFIFE